MKAEIIAVGTEILLGQIVNTNAVYLSEFLTNLGFDMYHQQVVGDNRERLLAVLAEASERSDLIVLCGGLGPTEDDLTKQVTAEFLGEKVIYDQEAMTRLEEYFAPLNRPVTENNKRQALTIEGGVTIQNPTGLACGVLYQQGKKVYLLLPGPPREMSAMAEKGAKPLLEKLLPSQGKLVSRYLNFIGIGESRLAANLDEMIKNQTNPTVASYAKSNEVMLRISAKSDTSEEANQLLDEMEQEIMLNHRQYFYGYGEHLTMEEVVVSLLQEKKQTLSVVEGLTGGLCGARITDVAGSSSVFEGGIIAYTNKSKLKLLGLKNEEVNQEHVISESHAKKLAESIRVKMGTDYGLCIIGVAGPLPIADSSVGTVFIGLASENETISQSLLINRERDYIKDGAVKYGLNLLRKGLI